MNFEEMLNIIKKEINKYEEQISKKESELNYCKGVKNGLSFAINCIDSVALTCIEKINEDDIKSLLEREG